jgi:hypothetical protein
VRRVQIVVAVELEALDQGERGLDVARFGDGDGPVELHDRRAGPEGNRTRGERLLAVTPASGAGL